MGDAIKSIQVLGPLAGVMLVLLLLLWREYRRKSQKLERTYERYIDQLIKQIDDLDALLKEAISDASPRKKRKGV